MMTKDYFDNGDRVVVTEKGENCNRHGKVIAHVTGDFNFQQQYQIQLDDGIQVKISGRFLTDESSSLDEKTEIKNLLKLITSRLPKNKIEELDINLKHLIESLKSKNKSIFDQQYNYISQELQRAVKHKTITEESIKPINTSFEKLKYWLKKQEISSTLGKLN
ncbi:hypothetical protein [Nostoc sp. CCY 9925]|uniref:hypothetical protein n=1 Tax=Nostoc sp. CCY 9925 TaxID=3103865 RepID=UPI0039C6F62F